VDLTRNSVSLPIRLNAVAIAAFKVLQKRSLNGKGEIFVNIEGKALQLAAKWARSSVGRAMPF
jgi:hypothetical protein